MSLKYDDPENEISEGRDIAFRQSESAPVSWEIGLEDEARTEFQWKAVFFFADGSQHDTDWQQ